MREIEFQFPDDLLKMIVKVCNYLVSLRIRMALVTISKIRARKEKARNKETHNTEASHIVVKVSKDHKQES